MNAVIKEAVYPLLAVVMMIVMPNKAVLLVAVYHVFSAVMTPTALFQVHSASTMFAKYPMAVVMMLNVAHFKRV
jgi:hypothetical protein